jgi:hypothetical protein
MAIGLFIEIQGDVVGVVAGAIAIQKEPYPGGASINSAKNCRNSNIGKDSYRELCAHWAKTREVAVLEARQGDGRL